MKRSPPSGSIRPAAIFSRVDLPEPLRPDQAHALARRHGQFGALEQRRAAEGEMDVAELDERW